MYFKLHRSKILNCWFSNDIVCACVCVEFYEGTTLCTGEYFSTLLQSSTHMMHIHIWTETRFCAGHHGISSYFKIPSHWFHDSLKGHDLQFERYCSKGYRTKQHSVLVIICNGEMIYKLFFLLCQYFNLDINVLKLFQKHMISSEFEIVSSKATVIIKWFVFLMVFKHLLR